MAEIMPRWNMKPLTTCETDAAKIEAEIIAGYEAVSGRTLAAGDPVRLFLLSQAAREIQLREIIATLSKQNFLTYAAGDFLDHMGVIVNTPRLPEAYAKTTLRFTLSAGLGNIYTIPAGFEVTNGLVTFSTDAEINIPAGSLTGEVSATCTQAGEIGNNYLAGQLTTIVTPRAFLAKAENITATAGGADAEHDAEYAERIRLATNAFSVAGPYKAYEYHAQSVSSAIIGVEAVSPSPGEVKVYLLTEGGELPSEELKQDVYAYLSADYIRPLTDEVEVLAPTPKEYAIKVDYYIFEDDRMKAETIKAAVSQAVEDYRLWQQTKIGRDINPNRLIHHVIAAGAARVELSTMTPAAYVKLSPYEVAQCTSATVNFAGYTEE